MLKSFHNLTLCERRYLFSTLSIHAAFLQHSSIVLKDDRGTLNFTQKVVCKEAYLLPARDESLCRHTSVSCLPQHVFHRETTQRKNPILSPRGNDGGISFIINSSITRYVRHKLSIV